MTGLERRVVGAAFATQALAVGTTIGALSLFVQPIAEALDAPLFQVSLGPSLIFLMMAVSGVVTGPYLDRGWIRTVMFGGVAGLTLCLLGAARASTLAPLALACIAAGFCIPLLGPLSGSALVGKVVDGHGRGRALGLMNMGAPAGGFVFALIAGAVIDAWSWRATLTLFGVALPAVCLPVIALGVPRRLPTAPRVEGAAPAGLSRRDLLRTGDYWAAAIAQGIGAGVAMGWGVHIAPYLIQLGAGTPLAAGVIAVGSALGVVGGLALGTLGDRIGPRAVMAGVLVTQGIGYAVYALEPPLPVAIATAAALGLLGGAYLPVYSALLAARFGPESLGSALGMTNVFMLPLGFGLPLVAGAVVDAHDTYRPALAGVAALFVAAALALTRLRGPLRH